MESNNSESTSYHSAQSSGKEDSINEEEEVRQGFGGLDIADRTSSSAEVPNRDYASTQHNAKRQETRKGVSAHAESDRSSSKKETEEGEERQRRREVEEEDLRRRKAEEDKVATLRSEAKSLFQSQSFAAAFHKYSELIALQPTNPLHWCNRAAARKMLDDMDGATLDCQRANALDPSLVKAYLRAAQAYLVLGDHKNALKQFEQGKTAAKSCKEYGIGRSSFLREVLKEQIQFSTNRSTKELEEEQLQTAARTQASIFLDEAEEGIKQLSTFEVSKPSSSCIAVFHDDMRMCSRRPTFLRQDR
jgi:tetratricopeptide (TPR) repeat protein